MQYLAKIESKILKNIDKNRLMPSSSNSQAGFTLMELAIVMIISGVLISLLGSALVSYTKKSRITTTEFRMDKIQEALDQYLNVNGRYPCAASRFLGPDEVNFAEEQVAACRGGAVLAGTARVVGQSGATPANNVRIGAVPTRSLNLPDEFIADAWGHKFTYAVTENLATSGQYSADGGHIAVIDGRTPTANSIIFPDNSAHYVIVSHGRTGNGSYPIGSATIPSVPCGSALDSFNCNDTSIFRSTLVNSDVGNATFFDDYVAFKGQTAPVVTIPSGAVMAFNLSACPTSEGWVEYTDGAGVQALRGRFVIGADPSAGSPTIAIDKYDMTLSNPLQTASLPIDVGVANAGDHEGAIPPYIALLYCVKQ